MPIIKEGWAEVLEPGIRAWFDTRFRETPDIRSQLFNVMTSTKSAEHVHTFGGVDPDSWDHFEDTKRIPEVSIDAGYKTTFTNVTKMVDLKIEREWVEDEQYGLITQMTRKLAGSMALKRQVDAASVFNNAFSGSFLGADGVALCSDSHPASPDRTGSTQDNNYALALSKDNVQTIREAMMAFTDDKGNISGIMPDTLLVPIGLGDEAIEITQSILDPDSANNARNPQNVRGWRVIEWQYLTDSNAWFMLDSMAMRDSLHWFERILPGVQLSTRSNEVFAVYNARMRYSYGWSDWRWLAGSNPS